jgi:hypothetical protein
MMASYSLRSNVFSPVGAPRRCRATIGQLGDGGARDKHKYRQGGEPERETPAQRRRRHPVDAAGVLVERFEASGRRRRQILLAPWPTLVTS